MARAFFNFVGNYPLHSCSTLLDVIGIFYRVGTLLCFAVDVDVFSVDRCIYNHERSEKWRRLPNMAALDARLPKVVRCDGESCIPCPASPCHNSTLSKKHACFTEHYVSPPSRDQCFRILNARWWGSPTIIIQVNTEIWSPTFHTRLFARLTARLAVCLAS